MSEIKGLGLSGNQVEMLKQLTIVFGKDNADIIGVIRHILVEQLPEYVERSHTVITNYNATVKAEATKEFVTKRTEEFYRNHTI